MRKWLHVQKFTKCSWLKEANYIVEVEHAFLIFRWTEFYIAGNEVAGSWEWYRLSDKQHLRNLSLLCFLDNAVHEARLGLLVDQSDDEVTHG